MIEREDLKYLKNIVDLQNKNVNYRTLDDIVYCIKAVSYTHLRAHETQ